MMWEHPESDSSTDREPRRPFTFDPKWLILLLLMVFFWAFLSRAWPSGQSTGFFTSFFGAIIVYKLLTRSSARRERSRRFRAEIEKRKRGEDDDLPQTVRYREPRIGVGDDGEMIELPDDYEDQPVKHKRDVFE